MKKLKRLFLDGKTYPYKIDLNVLESIQDSYGSIHQFEMDLLGYRYKMDDDGNQVYTENNTPVIVKGEPSIRAILAVLSAAINEGLAIEAEETGLPYYAVSDGFVSRNCNIDYNLLAKMLHEEFSRCFETKK